MIVFKNSPRYTMYFTFGNILCFEKPVLDGRLEPKNYPTLLEVLTLEEFRMEFIVHR